MTKTNTKEKAESTNKVEEMFIIKIKLNNDNTATRNKKQKKRSI